MRGDTRARMSRVPLAPKHSTVVVKRKVCPPSLLTVLSTNNVLSIRDHRGHRAFGFFYEHSSEALARWDVHLDSRDAAHERPDGSLPEAA